MEIKIKVTKDVDKKLKTIMHNIKELNDGDEIGAWLLGEWSKDEKDIVLKLDNMVIPEQEVHSTEVDISPESMLSTIKEIGPEEGNRIKAHWHIHPFSKDQTDWSGIDETKIASFTKPEKGRDIFVFLLSSCSQIKARVEINTKMVMPELDIEINKKKSIDNIPVEVIGEDERNEELIKELKKTIKSKVKKSKTTWSWDKGKVQTINNKVNYEGYNTLFTIRRSKKVVIVTIDKTFSSYIEGRDPQLISETDEIKKLKDNEIWIFKFQTKRAAQKMENDIEIDLLEYEEEYSEIELYNQAYINQETITAYE